MRYIFIAAAALLLATGAFAQSAIPAETYTHPQHLIVVEGKRRLNLFCKGHGTPAVLFDTGLGDSSVVWRYVQREVAKTTRACSYDRAGYGFSDPANRPSDVTNIVADIHRLLKASSISGPVIYVGHSMAGLYGVTLQASFPGDVAAEVLVDPSFPDQIATMTASLPKSMVEGLLAMQGQQMAARRACLVMAGQGELATPSTAAAQNCVKLDDIPYLHDAVLTRARGLEISKPTYLGAFISEMASFTPDAHMVSIDGDEVDAASPRFGDKPLIILTHGLPTPFAGLPPEEISRMDAAWAAGHDKMAVLSKRGSNVVVPDAGHYIQIDQPHAVIAAVESAVGDVRAMTR